MIIADKYRSWLNSNNTIINVRLLNPLSNFETNAHCAYYIECMLTDKPKHEDTT